jgi:hypothetical protein
MNDERPIEKLLRRYGEKRRADSGAPLEMHPATRRMLQGEVARQFPRPASDRSEPTILAQVLTGWRARLFWAVPMVIALGFGLWALIGPGEKPDRKPDLAWNAPLPVAPVAAPAKTVDESFKALEADKTVPPASAASLTKQPALAFADRKVPAEALESVVNSTASATDRFYASLADADRSRQQADASTVSGLAGISPDEPALKLESGRLLATDGGARRATGPSGETSVNQPALGAAAGILSDEDRQTKHVVTTVAPRQDSLQDVENLRRDHVAGTDGRLTGAPAGKPAAFAPEPSARFYRQESRAGSRPEPVQAYFQWFANRPHASNAAAPVLARFQVEQIGPQLRVIDGDGSTYVGELESSSSEKTGPVEVEQKGGAKLIAPSGVQVGVRPSPAAALPESPGPQRFAYRVIGTNRTLNKPVVFTWNFVALTNEPAGQFPGLLNHSSIFGRAQVGDGREIEINAVPVTR